MSTPQDRILEAFRKARTAKETEEKQRQEQATRDQQMRVDLRNRAQGMGEDFKNRANEMLEKVDEKPDLGLLEESHGIGFRLTIGKPREERAVRFIVGTVSERGWQVVTEGVGVARRQATFGSDEEMKRQRDELLMGLVEEAAKAVGNKSEDPR